MSWWKFWEDAGNGEDETPDYYAEGVQLAAQERFHEALTSFRLALRESPDDTAALEQMAVVYTRIGMTDEAIKTYRKALDADPESAPAHYGLGFLLLKRGQGESAAEHLEAFLAAAPEDGSASDHVRHARQTLERIRGESEEEAKTDA